MVKYVRKKRKHAAEACFFLSLYDSKKDKPAEINLLISHSRGSEHTAAFTQEEGGVLSKMEN